MVKIEIICERCKKLMRKVKVDQIHNRVEIFVECRHCELITPIVPPTPAITSLMG